MKRRRVGDVGGGDDIIGDGDDGDVSVRSADTATGRGGRVVPFGRGAIGGARQLGGSGSGQGSQA